MVTTPGATYRVQLHAGFGFDAAAALAPYLADLGVTHLYCSPILQAARGSTHGYDVVDHSVLNEELGGEDGFGRLARAMSERGIGLVVDIVPNHMATAGRANDWWWDVLENGPASPFAAYFDIDWDPPEAKMRQRVLVPVLGDHYGRVLERKELVLRRHGGDFSVGYFDHEVPVSPRTLDELLAEAVRLLESQVPPAAAGAVSDELTSLAHAFGRLPHASATDRASVEERHRDKQVLGARLKELCASHSEVAEAVDESVARVNADPDRLDTLLGRQNYRLAFWRVAGRELDYRRFFDISGLIGLRVEDPRVFKDSHALMVRLVEEGRVDGLRVDHPDGLRDPAGYLDRLAAATDGCWIVVEKILEGEEVLRPDWQTAGTTGYEFLNLVGGLFVDPAGELPLTELYRRYTGDEASFPETTSAAKREVMATSLAADVERLSALLVEVCEARRRYRDFTRVELRAALRELLAAMSVYRTYVTAGGRAGPEDVHRIEEAVDRARTRRSDLDPDLFDLLRRVLLGRERAPVDVELGQRFQQLSGPVMAKGVEDTAFYRYSRLLCLNEVGGDPSRFGVDPGRLHEHNARIQRDWPSAMLASSTHDTKRSEDVRARLALLSEIPDEWAAAVHRWSALADRHRRDGVPDGRALYVLFQTLFGAHPIDSERVKTFMLKAAREAKLATSWTDPDLGYESALTTLVDGLLSDPEMLEALDSFVRPLIAPGRLNALAQLALKLTSPGVPDIYQGNESWDLSLVDPDNRRPVDHASLAQKLDQLMTLSVPDALARADEGLPKLLFTQRVLALRAARPGAFGSTSSYEPLWAAGPTAAHVVAYGRAGQVITVVPRLVLGLERAGGWGETVIHLPPGEWMDQVSQEIRSGPVALDDLLSSLGVAVMERL